MDYRSRKPSVVTAGEVSRNFGQWQDRAFERPVVVTHHGRPRVVILASEHCDLEGGGGEISPESPVAKLEALSNAVAEGFIALDEDLVIAALNPAMQAYLGLSAFQLVGRSWAEAFPSLRDGVLHEQFRRVLRTGEVVELEIASTLFPGRVISQKVFPYGGGVAALVTNLTAERERERQVQEAAAVERLAAAAPGLCLITVNLRGIIAGVDPSFIALSGFEAEALSRVRLADIIRPRDRTRLLASLEAAIEDDEVPSLNVCLMARDGREESVTLTLACVLRYGRPDSVRVAITRAATTEA